MNFSEISSSIFKDTMFENIPVKFKKLNANRGGYLIPFEITAWFDIDDDEFAGNDHKKVTYLSHEIAHMLDFYIKNQYGRLLLHNFNLSLKNAALTLKHIEFEANVVGIQKVLLEMSNVNYAQYFRYEIISPVHELIRRLPENIKSSISEEYLTNMKLKYYNYWNNRRYYILEQYKSMCQFIEFAKVA